MNAVSSRKILTSSTGALSPAELNNGVQTFNTWYHLESGQSFSGIVSLRFQDLKDVVTSFMQAESINEAEVACRFIHRFDTGTNTWFPCLEMARMQDLKKTDPNGRAEYSITGFQKYRYDINNGLSASQLTGSYDPVYFEQVYYPTSLGIEKPLIVGQNVQSVVFPWQRELLRLCQQNNLENVTGAKIVLQSIALPPAYQGDALIAWPHSIAFYMRNAQGQDCLGPNSGNLVFHNQAADVGTSCPTKCNTYHMPQNLPL